MRMCSPYPLLLISVKPYIIPSMPRKEKPLALDSLFRALADPTRLRLLNLIADKEICVCHFVEILKMSQPKISRHLAYLRRAGIVSARRQGRWMHYRLRAPGDAIAAAILKGTMAHLRQLPDMERDLAKLETTCCAPVLLQVSRQAPQPLTLPVPSQ
jgi:ArsR family transcriptional regulator, arsenate/arsenite/antimonite-responsive transcriptional repressor